MSSYLLSILVEAEDKASAALGGIGSAIAGIGKIGLAVAGGGIAALGGAIVAGIGDAREAAKIMAQTEAVIKSTGGAAGVTAQQVADYASSLSAAAGKSLFGDDQIQQSENLLLTFTNIKGKALEAATAISVDMAQALGGEPKDAAIQLGKALNDPIAGVSALSRVGVTFDEQQKAQIKTMVKSGNVMGAQQIILAELNKEFGGSAAAAAAADGGWAQFKDRLGEVAESVGGLALPLLNRLAGFFNDTIAPALEGVAPFLDNFIQSVQIGAMWSGHLGDVIATALAPVLGETFAGAIGTAVDGVQRFGEVAATTFGIVRDLLGGLVSFINSGDFDAFDGLGTRIAEAFGGDAGVIRDVIDGVANAIRNLVLAFTDAPNPIQGLIAALATISPTFALVKAGIDAALPPIQAIITTVFGIISGFLSEHGAKIQADLTGAWQQIQAIINAVIPPIQSIISAVFGAIAAFLAAHGTEIQAVLALAWDTIALVVQTALALIEATIVPALQYIAAFISAHGAEIQAILGAVWTIIRSIITIALSLIQGIIKTALALIRGDFQGAWTTIQNLNQTVWNAIKAALQAVWTIIQTIFSTAFAKIKSDTLASLTFIQTLWKTVWELIYRTFQGILESVVNWVKLTFQSIVGAIRGFADQAASAAGGVARAIVDGIADGISSGASRIISAAKDAALSALNAAKKALGIASPSKLFRAEIGQNIGAGMALGITDMIPRVTSGASSLAGAATAGASSAVTNNYTLNYAGAPAEATDVRQALRAQALLTGALSI